MNAEVENRVDAADAIIRRGGKLALDYFRAPDRLQVEHKGPQDRVSEADREVERLIRDELDRRFPRDRFLGEETGLVEPSDASGFTWVVDPIDGTDCFVHAIPVWSVSIALLRGEEIAAGLVFDPCADELFRAARGDGARLNGAPVRASDARSIDAGVVGVGFSHRVDPAPTFAALAALASAGGLFQRNGSAALTLAYVAAGRYLGFFEAHINSWDVLAGLALVAEAGGRCSPFLDDDGLHRGNPVVAAAPGVAAELERICAPLLNPPSRPQAAVRRSRPAKRAKKK